MQQLDSYLADRALTRQLYLLRFTAGEQKKVLAILTQTQKELRLKLLGDLTDFSKARVNKLLSESTAIIEAAYKEMVPITKTVEMEIPANRLSLQATKMMQEQESATVYRLIL